MEAAPSVIWMRWCCRWVRRRRALSASGHALEFVKDHTATARHPRARGHSAARGAGIPTALPTGAADPGLLLMDAGDVDTALESFVDAVTKHRHWEREQTDPPVV